MLIELCKEENPNIEEIKVLLKNGANVTEKNKWGETPLYWASRCGYLEVVKLLLENRASHVRMFLLLPSTSIDYALLRTSSMNLVMRMTSQ